jgi:perosamine synthetase
MNIRFQVSKPVLCGNEKKYVNEAIDSGWISSNGFYLTKFEEAIAAAINVEECIATNNGTTALHLACLALGLKPGDEVIVPSLTYVASANAIAYCGAKPVFVDCDLQTWNATAEFIDNAWTPKTVGVLAVHLYGMPCNIEAISALCKEKGAWLIEDCAESFGATVKSKPTGSFGDAATFSFYGNKTISTGEGGAVYIRDPEKRHHAKMLRGQGMDLNKRYWHPILGYNYRMTNIAAAIGLGQIEMLDFHLSERRRIAESYYKGLESLERDGLIYLPAKIDEYRSTYWLFSLVLSHGGELRRDKVMQRLMNEYGIETRPFFVPMNWLPMYQSELIFQNTEFLSTHGINLPTYTGLSNENILEICREMTKVIKEVI